MRTYLKTLALKALTVLIASLCVAITSVALTAQMRIDGIGRGITTVGTLLFADGSATAPSVAFASQSNKGMFSPASNRVGFAAAGGQSVDIDGGAARFIIEGSYSFGWGSPSVTSPDLFLVRAAADSLALRNGTNAQTFTMGAATGTARAILRSGAPTVGGSCGTGPTIVGSNAFGKVTTGTGAPTSCTVTFSSAWTNAPACNVANETTANLARATSTTTTVILAGTFVAGDVLAYQCGGY